jgi:hypothetical protein
MAFGNLTDQLAILKRQDLTPTEKFVAVVALSFRNAESGRCNPAIISDDSNKETLCSRSGYTKQCVTKTLRSLAAKGVLSLKKAIARPSEITFTVNDVYGKQGLPSTTITDTVNDVYGKGKQRLPITDKEQINEQINLSVDDSPFSLEPDQPQAANELPAENTTSNTEATAVCTVKHPAETKKPAKRKAITHLFELEAIPDEWRELCEQIRPDLDPQRVFVEFRFYWTQGKGMGTRRSDKGWTSTWMNWIKRQKEQRVAQTNGKAPLPPHRDPAFHFGKEYYDKSVNPDGTTNWGV